MSDTVGVNAPSFAEKVQTLGACKAFSVALPAICRQYGVEVGLIFQSAGDGVGIGFTMPDKTPGKVQDAISQEVLRRVEIVERLFEIESLVAAMKQLKLASVDAEAPELADQVNNVLGRRVDAEIDRLVEEGESLARRLHPENGPTDL